jgi:hypothetical protein
MAPLEQHLSNKAHDWFEFVPYAGWRWVPITWQGWLVFLALFASFGSLILFFVPAYDNYPPYVIIPLCLFLTFALLRLFFYICNKKTTIPPELRNWPFS